MFCKVCFWPELNCGPLVSEAIPFVNWDPGTAQHVHILLWRPFTSIFGQIFWKSLPDFFTFKIRICVRHFVLTKFCSIFIQLYSWLCPTFFLRSTCAKKFQNFEVFFVGRAKIYSSIHLNLYSFFQKTIGWPSDDGTTLSQNYDILPF